MTADYLSDRGHWERIGETARSSTGIFTIETLATMVDACRALIDVHDHIAAADRYAANEAKQREEAEPDPLDEDDHRDRIDVDGDIWQRVHERCWMEPGFPPVSHGPAECLQLAALPGPLTFAPEPPQEATGDDQSASEGESRAMEGPDADDAQEAILCPECNHHIHTHDMDGCLHILCCPRTPEDVARALIEQTRDGRD